jgi:hypothetical protein
MLELTLCSMLTILPDYLYRRFAHGLVRTALGHNAVPSSDRHADHDDLLLPSSHDGREFGLPDRHDPSRGIRARGRDIR